MKTLVAGALALSCVSCTDGECTGPGNAWAFPSQPVPVQEDLCHYYQVYQAISPTTSYPDCGYTVAFGPQGDLKHPGDGYWLQADWGEVVTTPADCENSHTSGQAWGYRCEGFHCADLGQWERIGDWKTRSGYWNSVSNACYLGLSFSAAGINYNTVQVQVNAYRGSGANKVAKRAKGHIYVFRHTGHCLTATPAPTPTPRHAPEPPTPKG